METGLQELDETAYWLELVIEADIFGEQKIAPLIDETKQLNAIFTTIVRKVKRRKQ